MAQPSASDGDNNEKKRLLTRESAEELALLRQKIASFSLRGDYRGCAKFIEDHLAVLYRNDRWPDTFFSILRTYQRCYPSLGLSAPFDEHLTGLLKKNDVPFVFESLLRGADSAIVWSADYFKNLAVLCETHKDYETALSYCDLTLKLDPGNSSAYTVRGWILDDLEKPREAAEMYRQALALSDANHGALNSLAKHYAEDDPQEALALIDRAIGLSSAESAYYDTKARILLRLNDRDGAVSCYDLAMTASPYAADYPYQKAELLLFADREMAAIAMYKKAIALDDNHVPSLWRLAVLYQDSQPAMALVYAGKVAELDPGNSDVLLLRGILLSALGEEAAARQQYEDVLTQAPKNAEAHARLASLLVMSDPASALAYYQKALALKPKTVDYHMGKARAYENLGDTHLAAKEYKTVISLNRKNPRAFGRLGALLADTKPREAVECYSKALALMPDNSFYYAAKAELLMHMPNRKAEAISCFNEASKYDPQNANLHLYLSKLLEDTGNATAAAVHCRQAVALGVRDAGTFFRLAGYTFPAEPEVSLLHINSAISLDAQNAEYYYFKAKILSALGHDQGAVRQLTESLEANGKNPDVLNELSSLTGHDSPRVSLMYINRAIEIAPGNQDYLCTRAELLLSVGENEKAALQYAEILKRAPKNHKALFGMGRCLALRPDPAALDYYNKALSAAPQTAAYHAGKADFLADRNELEAAILEYDLAVAIEPESWPDWLAKAKVLEKLNRNAQATECYEKVLSIKPGCAEALGNLGVLLTGETPGKAVEYLNRAIAILPDNYLYRAFRGKAFLALGSDALAAVEYKEAARLGGETGETYYTLAGILREKQPETALGYCLRAIAENPAVAGYHLLCGTLYLTLNAEAAALAQFKEAIALDVGCHEAMERIADMQHRNRDPGTLDAVNRALQSNPACNHCLGLKLQLLEADSEADRTDEMLECLDAALKSEPGLLPERQKLIALLHKKRMFTRLILEKHKLGKLLKAEKKGL